MKKIEFWRKVKENGGGCYSILCDECPYSKKGYGCTRPNYKTKKDAESYIKRHEGKSKKKDHIRDTTKKVEEPKPVKTVGIDNSDVTLAKPTVKENLSVPCEHLVNGDSCGNAFEPCDKDCPANPEIPQPIKFDDPVPEYVYYFNGISTMERIAVSSFSAYKKPDSFESFAVDVIGRVYPLTDCYRTPEEALQVAKKLWQGEKK